MCCFKKEKKRVTQPHGQATQVNVINCANDITAAAVTDNKQPILKHLCNMESSKYFI